MSLLGIIYSSNPYGMMEMESRIQENALQLIFIKVNLFGPFNAIDLTISAAI